MAKVNVYQIYYLDGQKPELEKAFIPYSNLDNTRPEWFEYHVFRKEYFKKTLFGGDYTGFFSWKYRQKSLISGDDFIKFIHQNPGYDAYFVNPYPHDSFMVRNVWFQGDKCHPHLMDFTQKLFDKLKFGIDLKELRNTPESTGFCNYWVGNQKFWEKYIALAEPIYQYIENCLTPEEQAFISTRADKQIKASYHPFIMERLFSTLLAKDSEIKYLNYPLPREWYRSKYPYTYEQVYLAMRLYEQYRSNPTPEGEVYLTGFRDLFYDFNTLAHDHQALLHAPVLTTSTHPQSIADPYAVLALKVIRKLRKIQAQVLGRA